MDYGRGRPTIHAGVKDLVVTVLDQSLCTSLRRKIRTCLFAPPEFRSISHTGSSSRLCLQVCHGMVATVRVSSRFGSEEISGLGSGPVFGGCI
jgi:hypothetical protein